MSAFYSSPKGPHIGQCQNFIIPRGAEHGHYCLAPVLGLGGELATDRDICGGCQMRGDEYRRWLTARFVDELDPAGVPEWVRRSQEILAGSDRHRAERAAAGASMAELFEIRRDIESREQILDAVLAAHSHLDTWKS